MNLNKQQIDTSKAAESARAFFNEVLYLKIDNGGVWDTDRFDALPLIVTNKGLTLEKLAELSSIRGLCTEFAILNMQEAVANMKSQGLVIERNGKIFATEDAVNLFSFLGDRSSVNNWIQGELGRARRGAADNTERMKENADKIKTIIETMLYTADQSLKNARRQ